MKSSWKSRFKGSTTSMLRNRRSHLGGRGRPLTRSCLLFLLLLVGLCGCVSPMGRFADGLTNGVGRCPDLNIARDGIPACILMIESSLSTSPDDPQLLRAAGDLYSFYGVHLIKDEKSARRMTQHALEYTLRAAGADIPGIEDARKMDFEVFEAIVSRAGKSDVPALFSLGSVWMDWIRVRKDDLDAIADLSKIETIMEGVVRLDATYRAGAAYFYLALLAAWQPAEDGVVEAHFRRAIAAADGKSLMPSVFHALWLRDMDDARRCQQLLQGIVESGMPDAPAYTLINQLALEKAQQALADLDAHE